jgi:hypothetical protein
VDVPNEFKPGDVTVKKDESEGKLAMDMKNGTKPGLYTFFLRSDSKVKYQLDPGSVTQAEEVQKKLDEIVKQLAEEVKQQTEAVNKAKEEAAKNKTDDTAKALAEAEQKLKEIQDRSNRATEAKKKADADLDAAKKATAAKDVNFAVYSTPIRIRVLKSPVVVTAQEQAELKPGDKLAFPVKLEKKFGFDEPVDITIGLPGGVAGITAAKLQIAKGQAEGMLELTANDKPTAGDHVVTIVAKGKFNNVDVQSETTVTVKVAEAAAQ